MVPLTGTLDGISPALAVLAGLVSFVSPCVLPLVPAYLAYLGAQAGQPAALASVDARGVATHDSARLAPTGLYSAPNSARLAPAVRFGSPSFPLATAGIGFVAGLSLIFILFFYVFSFAVQPIRAYVPVVAGVLVIGFALHVAGLIRLPYLDREYRVMDRAPSRGGVAGGFVLGMGFASGWTPCIGVTLGAVLSSAVTTGTTSQGLVLMVAYCLGLGLPFVALAFALERARPLIRVINSHRQAIDLVSAGVLLVMGLLLLTNKLTILAAGITQLVPSWPSGSL